MKILSIDLDYIMSPCIELYNEAFFDHNPGTRWRNLYENTPLREGQFQIDISNLMYCYNTFLKAIKQCENVSFGYAHDSILQYISDFSDIELINIDHHDDVFAGDFDDDYHEKSLDKEYYEIVESGRVHEGNWIAWLASKQKLSSYTWIGNSNSKNKSRNNANSMFVPNYSNVEKENYQIEDYNFDHVFVCLSPQYVPHKYWHYFSMFVAAYEEFSGKDARIKDWSNKVFESQNRYLQTTDEILHQCSTGRG